MTGVATVRAVAPTAGEAVVIAGAGGGVGVFAVQLRGADGRPRHRSGQRAPSPMAERSRRGSRCLRRRRQGDEATAPGICDVRPYRDLFVPAENETVFDHVSIQCADTARSAAFFDAVLVPLGGCRIMDFGQVVGFGVDGKPQFWIGPRQTGEGFRECHVAFVAPSRAAVREFFAAATQLARMCSTSLACGLTTTPTTTELLCVTPTATTWRLSATCRSSLHVGAVGGGRRSAG